MSAEHDFNTAVAFGDDHEARSIWGAASVAQTGNFLDASSKPLAMPKVLAPLSAAKPLTVATSAKVPTVSVATKGAAVKPATIQASSKIVTPAKSAAAKGPAVPQPAPASTKPAASGLAGALTGGISAGLSSAVTTALNAALAAGSDGGFPANTIPPGVALGPLDKAVLLGVPGARVVQARDGSYSVQVPKQEKPKAPAVSASAKLPAPVPASTAPAPLSDAERRARQAELDRSAAQNANINARPGGYSDQRLEDHDAAMRLNTALANSWVGKAGTDLDQFIMGGKVLAVGASIIASGGVVAGGLGITAGAGSLAAAAGADQLLSAIETGGKIADQANAVLSEAKAAAAKGDKIAQTALDVVSSVSADRIAAKVPKGVKQALTPTAKDAVAAVASTPAVVNAIAAANAASGGYMTTPLSASGPKATAPIVNQATARILSTIQRPRALWLVSNAGGITSLERTPNAAWSGGFVVFSSGLVMRQTAEAAALAGAAA